MAQKDPGDGPSLELPSLFGRRKRRTGSNGDTTTDTKTDTKTDTAPDRAVAAEEDTAVVPRAETVEAPPVESAPLPPVESAPLPPAEADTPDHTTVIPVVEEPVVEEPARRAPVEPPVAAAPAATPAPPPGRRARAGTRKAPQIGASTAAFLVGAAVGLLGCALTYVGLQGCEVVTGVSSCGGPGLLVLVVILVAMVLVGAVVLRWLRVPDAGNLSFLGVGMMTAIALLFLIDYLYDPWMFLVIPAVTAMTFGIAQWITTRYTEDIVDDDDDGKMPHHDIR